MDLQNFGFIPPTDMVRPLFQLYDLGVEKRSDTEYYYDNTNRPDYAGYLIQYTLEGKGCYVVDGAYYTLSPGDAFFVKVPEKSHYTLATPEVPWTFLYLHIGGEGIDYFYRLLHQKSVDKGTAPLLQICRDHIAIPGFMSFHHRLCKGHHPSPHELSDFLSRFLHNLVYDLSYNPDNLSHHVSEAIDIMTHQFSTIESIASLADRLNLSHEHLTRTFHTETGVSPHEYLQDLRLKRAIHLLLNTNTSINAIALQCGFSSGNYFSKVFSKAIGLSPKVYRQQRKH